jgi:hypothetical protein
MISPTYGTARSPDRYTDGPVVGEATARWLGRRPTPWQQNTLDVALERIDGPGSPFAFDQIVVVVGRRCGKTVTAFGPPLARALAGPVTLPNGRIMPFRATHTAQNLHAARQRFTEDLVEPYRRHFSDVEWAMAAEFKRAAADTTLTLDPRRGRSRKHLEAARRAGRASELRVLAPTSSSARGAGVLHRSTDEVLTFARSKGEEMEAAGRPTMAEMMGHAQTWLLSNVGIDTDEHTWLWHLRQKGRQAVGIDRRDGVCYIEFSLPADADPEDEREWWAHYPALSDGIVGIRELRRDREEFGAAVFTAEYLCRWPDEQPGGVMVWPAITEWDWQRAETLEEQPEGAVAALGVDIDPFGRSATLVAAVADPTAPDTVLVEVIDHRPGSVWVADAVRAMAGRVGSVCIDDYGPNRDLGLALEGELAEKLMRLHQSDFIAASFHLDNRLREGTMRHRPHPALTAAAAAAQRTTGKGWQWERRVHVSQSPIVASTLAVWALAHADAPAPSSAIF